MRSITIPALLLVVCCGSSLAQETRYVSDTQYVPLRSGAGTEYRITHRGLPSGTRLTVDRTSQDGVWSEITTDRGTSGWIRTQYLMQTVPAALQLQSAQAMATAAEERSATLEQELGALKLERSELQNQVTSSSSDLDTVSAELNQLKQISGKSVQLDTDNRRLIEQTETLRSEVEMLEAENQRLQDKLRSEDFINGALAVLMGVVIALVAPRLMPKRRKNSSWA
ncbi:MAG: TIGR04211 family SH3 domain-containing protein [Pseudomonadota bacterium]